MSLIHRPEENSIGPTKGRKAKRARESQRNAGREGRRTEGSIKSESKERKGQGREEGRGRREKVKEELRKGGKSK